jgi:signal transduction histidine kinase
MHAGETHGSGNGVRPARARPFAERTRQVEAAVLCAAAAGASPAEIAARFGATDPALDRTEIERHIADLQRRGLLRAAADTERSPSNLTESGRQKILDLAAQWLSMAEELEAEREQVERLRTDLLSTISHELRTPLTLIRTSIGLLLDSDPDAAMRFRLLRNIQQSSERMHALVNDLLDLARLRGDRFPLQTRTVDTGALVAGAVSLMRPLLDAKGQDVALAIPSPAPTIVGDYRRLERVLLNLLGNANTFAPVGTTITVTVQDGARQVTIAVRDAGPGIAAEAMPHLFEQFFTSRTSSSRHNIGVGLGLPIAQGIVAAHGGRIWVDSTLGAGTTVSFTLPKVALQEESDEGAGSR